MFMSATILRRDTSDPRGAPLEAGAQGCPARSGVRKKPLAAQERRLGTFHAPRPVASGCGAAAMEPALSDVVQAVQVRDFQRA